MPVIGWLAGLSLRDYISDFDHWIAFGLLSFIGCKMIYEAFEMEADHKEVNPLNVYVLLMLSVATSIDALAVGLSFAFLQVNIASASLTIGVTAFVVTIAGMYLGRRVGALGTSR